MLRAKSGRALGRVRCEQEQGLLDLETQSMGVLRERLERAGAASSWPRLPYEVLGVGRASLRLLLRGRCPPQPLRWLVTNTVPSLLRL